MNEFEAADVHGIRAEHILDASETFSDSFVHTFYHLQEKDAPPPPPPPFLSVWCTANTHAFPQLVTLNI